ncbi:MAG: DUF1559 domain-containing protein [Anaerolineaceae bacterium]|nr:DUF1559 domain-containing protein [Anaerolineaceae bacterium]
MKRKAFTLVELLMVVAIIALLLAILMPALSGVFRQGVAVQCGANLHQIGLGLAQYRSQNKGYFPGGRPASSTGAVMNAGNGRKIRPRWYVHLWPTMGPPFDEPSTTDQRQTLDNPAYMCPAVPWDDERNFPYGYNYQFLGNNRNNLAGTDTINYPVSMNDIKVASRTVVAADSMGTAADYAEADRQPYSPKSGDFDRYGNHGWTLDPPHLPGGNYVSANPNVSGHRSSVDARHNGQANVLFADGHIDSMTPEELGYNVAEDGQVLHDGDNTLFSGDGTDRLPPTAD